MVSDTSLSDPTILSQARGAAQSADTINRVAQDLVEVPGAVPQSLSRLLRTALAIRGVRVMPPRTSLGPVRYTWPLVAFVAGVKIGSGKRSDSRRPAGSAMPQMLPVPR